jgi:hypothetical protein
MSSKELSVIIPAWNESEHIFHSVKETGKVLENSGLDYQQLGDNSSGRW